MKVVRNWNFLFIVYPNIIFWINKRRVADHTLNENYANELKYFDHFQI